MSTNSYALRDLLGYKIDVHGSERRVYDLRENLDITQCGIIHDEFKSIDKYGK